MSRAYEHPLSGNLQRGDRVRIKGSEFRGFVNDREPSLTGTHVVFDGIEGNHWTSLALLERDEQEFRVKISGHSLVVSAPDAYTAAFRAGNSLIVGKPVTVEAVYVESVSPKN